MSNSKFSAPSKIYIARLLGRDVFDPFGDRLGRLRDVVVRSIDASQIISTGLVNLRRFEQRNSETLIVGELFDRRVRLLDGSGDAVIEDVAIEQRRNGDWGVTELFVSRVSSGSSTWRRRSKETLIVDWDEALLSTDVEPQAATAFVANHENSKPADLADER